MSEGKPGLLLFGENMAWLGGAVLDRFTVFRLWEEADAETAIARRGRGIVAILTAGKDRIDATLMDRLPGLRVIAAAGAGHEGVDVGAALARGITVANAGDTHSGDVADHAVGLALAAIQRVARNDAWVRGGGWAANGYPPARRALSAQRFGIVGLGRIGTAIAERLAPFGGAIAWWGPTDRPARWPRMASVAALADWSTTLIVAARGDARAVVDRAAIEALGRDGLIVNVARGGVIDEDAMIAALRDGRLGGAALDVFVDEPATPARWADVPNVILSPHVAAQTIEAMARLREAAAQNLLAAIDGRPVVNLIAA